MVVKYVTNWFCKNKKITSLSRRTEITSFSSLCFPISHDFSLVIEWICWYYPFCIIGSYFCHWFYKLSRKLVLLGRTEQNKGKHQEGLSLRADLYRTEFPISSFSFSFFYCPLSNPLPSLTLLALDLAFNLSKLRHFPKLSPNGCEKELAV